MALRSIAFERASAIELAVDLETFLKQHQLDKNQVVAVNFCNSGNSYGEKHAVILVYDIGFVQEVEAMKETPVVLTSASEVEAVITKPEDFVAVETVNAKPIVDREALQLECKRLIKESAANKQKLFELLRKFEVKKFTDLPDFDIDAFAEEVRKIGGNI